MTGLPCQLWQRHLGNNPIWVEKGFKIEPQSINQLYKNVLNFRRAESDPTGTFCEK